MRRLGLMMLALVVSGPSAFAQSRNWVPWGEVGASPSPSVAQQAKPANTTMPKPSAQPGGFSVFSGGDDDDAPFASAPGGNLPYKPSSVQYPAVVEGGGRPEISPAAPPVVAFRASYAANSIVIDTSNRSLYYVIGNGRAYRYPISVGRDGFRWKGTEKITRVASWPDWHPPAEMRQRDPRLPEVMTGGIRNPLGAKALYLGNSLYRIHGTNDAKSIGYAASSGCFRMMNYHVLHLGSMAGVGTTVHVLDHISSAAVASTTKPKG